MVQPSPWVSMGLHGPTLPVPRREVYLLDLPTSSANGSFATRADLSVQRLDCGTAAGRLPRGHPSMNGAASDFDPISDSVVPVGVQGGAQGGGTVEGARLEG